MKVSRVEPSDAGKAGDETDDDDEIVLGKDLPVLPNNHGPQTDRLDLRSRSLRRLRLRRPDEP